MAGRRVSDTLTNKQEKRPRAPRGAVWLVAVSCQVRVKTAFLNKRVCDDNDGLSVISVSVVLYKYKFAQTEIICLTCAQVRFKP